MIDYLPFISFELFIGYRPLQKKKSNVRACSKIDYIKESVSKIDQLRCVRIAVDRFSKRTSTFDRFFKGVFLLDRLLIEGIDIIIC